MDKIFGLRRVDNYVYMQKSLKNFFLKLGEMIKFFSNVVFLNTKKKKKNGKKSAQKPVDLAHTFLCSLNELSLDLLGKRIKKLH